MSEVNKFIQVEDPQPLKKKNFFLLILDESGSMDNVKDVTRNGVNELLQTIRSNAKEFTDQEFYVTLLAFANKMNPIYINEKIDPDHEVVKDIPMDKYKPDGGTALNDAIAWGVRTFKETYASDLKNPMHKVQVNIFTDGDENASTEFPMHGGGTAAIKQMLAEVQATKQWTVSFIGCDESHVTETAQSLGIDTTNTLTYRGGIDKSAGAKYAFDALKSATKSYSMNRVSDMYKETDEGVMCCSQDLTKGFFAGIDPDVQQDSLNVPKAVTKTPKTPKK